MALSARRDKWDLIARVACILMMMLVSPRAAVAAVSFYVDPDWGGSKTGAAATPWNSLNDTGAWTTINNTLASSDVTVYFSARAASSDANQTTSTALNVLRTDTGSHRLTLDGKSQYNTNDAAPSWSPNPGSRQFEISASYPVSTGTGERDNVTVHGFRLKANPNGQIVFWWGGNNVVIEDNEGSSTAGATIGPGIYFQYTEHEGGTTCPTPRQEESCAIYTNLTIRRNYIHDTQGEGIYIGGCANNTGCLSHDGILIEGNTLRNIAVYGGEGDAIDLKDGLRNLTVRGNDIRLQTESRCGITTESAALVERNYIESAGLHGIYFSGFWHNALGARANPVARNNIVVNTGGSTTFGYTYRVGIFVESTGGTNEYTNPAIYNNSVYGVLPVGNSGYGIATAVPGTSIRNNIARETASATLSALAGTLTAKDHNLWFTSGSTPVVVDYGGTTYTTATITSFDADSLAVDPLYTSTGTPYAPGNFSLQGGSPALAVGVTLTSLFTDDYLGSVRGTTWDMGAIKHSLGPIAPSGVKVVP